MNRKNVSAATIGVMAVLSAGFAATAFQNQPTTTPTPRPAQPTPNTPNTTPTQPRDTTQPGVTDPTRREVNPRDKQPGNANRYNRPFAFESPDYEARFTENSRKLLRLEQKMNTQNQELLRRLGEARQLSGERQNAAMFDIMQQMLRDNQAMHEYLVQSRTAWSGDLEDPTLANPNDRNPNDRTPSDRTTNPTDRTNPTPTPTPTPTQPTNPNTPTPTNPSPR